MFNFIWPFAILALPLPWLVRHLWRSSRILAHEPEALWVPFFEPLRQKVQGRKTAFMSHFSLIFLLSWVFFVGALMRPLFIGDPQFIPSEYRHLMLVLDVSDSMSSRDFSLGPQKITRLDMVKVLADDFLTKRQGDQVGLVLFGEEAYVYVPLTSDLVTTRSMLQEVNLGIAGPRTAMGDALALALKNMKDIPASSKVIILISDGFANAGQIHPEEVLLIAKEMGVKIYTIGVGADEMMEPSFFGSQMFNPSADLDEALLTKIANETGGQYFRAKTTQDMQRIYQQLDQLEPVESTKEMLRPIKELFYYPLGVTLILLALGFWVKEFKK